MDEERLAKCLGEAADALKEGSLHHMEHWLRMAADACTDVEEKCNICLSTKHDSFHHPSVLKAAARQKR